MTSAGELLAEEIRRAGPVRFDRVMEVALYGPDVGFFAAVGEAGRRGDFLTSPEVGPLFGAVVAAALDRWWRELGEPDPFLVVEAGAGRGALAIAVRRAAPDCLTALTYVLVERSEPLRRRQGEHLPLETPALALLPSPLDGEASELVVGRGTGPRFTSLADLPAIPVTGVILANELLDNLPFRVVRRESEGWSELHAALGADDELIEQFVSCPAETTTAFDRSLPDLPVGAQVPIPAAAIRWCRTARALLHRGRLVVIDYGADTGLLAAYPGGWLRTFRAHDRGVSPLSDVGRQDITGDVPVDQLIDGVGEPSSHTSQADLLRAFGIEALVEEGRRQWEERGHVGDLAAIAGRSRVREAEALLDPDGLGAFRVLEWPAL